MKRRGRQRQRFTALLTEHATYVRRLARKLSRCDRDLFEDLYQEGLFALWRMDPVTPPWALDPESAERSAIRNAMRRFRRSVGTGGLVMVRLQ